MRKQALGKKSNGNVFTFAYATEQEERREREREKWKEHSHVQYTGTENITCFCHNFSDLVFASSLCVCFFLSSKEREKECLCAKEMKEIVEFPTN